MILGISVLEEDLGLLFNIFNILSEETTLHVLLPSDHIRQLSEGRRVLITSEGRLEEVKPSEGYDPVDSTLILEYYVRVHVRPAATPTIHSDILVLIHCKVTFSSRQIVHTRNGVELYARNHELHFVTLTLHT